MRMLLILKRVGIRLLQTIPLLFGVIIITFILLSIAPGDPAEILLSTNATPENIQAMRQELGLNDPLLVQLWNFLKGIFTELDFGFSYQNRQPVITEIFRTLPLTITLATLGILLSSTVGIFVGVVSAVKQYSFTDNALRVLVLFLVSMPVFWLGLVLLYIFASKLGWLPSYGWGTIEQMILPVVTLSCFPLASITRMTRSNMLEVLKQDYICTARAKGLSSTSVIFHHALRNAFIPVVTVIGLQFTILLTGALLCETIFALPGLGRLTVSAVFARDYPIIRGAIILASLFVTLVNLAVDIVYSILDPRIIMR
jgi:ABC-type dipeptide/oligopeptide/nickel transport system permease component